MFDRYIAQGPGSIKGRTPSKREDSTGGGGGQQQTISQQITIPTIGDGSLLEPLQVKEVVISSRDEELIAYYRDGTACDILNELRTVLGIKVTVKDAIIPKQTHVCGACLHVHCLSMTVGMSYYLVFVPWCVGAERVGWPRIAAALGIRKLV